MLIVVIANYDSLYYMKEVIGVKNVDIKGGLKLFKQRCIDLMTEEHQGAIARYKLG